MLRRFYYFSQSPVEICQGKVGKDKCLVKVKRLLKCRNCRIDDPLFLKNDRLQIAYFRIELIDRDSFFTPLQSGRKISLIGQGSRQERCNIPEGREVIRLIP